MFLNFIPDFNNWRFDPLTSGLTLIFAPLGVYLLFVVRRFLKEAIKYVVDGLVYAPAMAHICRRLNCCSCK